MDWQMIAERGARFALGIVVIVASACSSATPSGSSAGPSRSTAAGVQSIEIGAADFSFTVSDTVSAGWTKVTLKNGGKELHHVQFFRARAGVTGQQLQDAIKVGPAEIFKIASAEGGAGTTVPVSSTETYVDLLPGTYLLACFVSGGDGVPHLAKGMTKIVTVTDTAGGSLLTAPTTEGTVELKDFAIQSFPDTLTAGRHVFRVTNTGPQPHEANILQLAPGKTARDAIDFFTKPAGPPPFKPVGGVQGVTAGVTDAILVADLTPGTYLAICNIPDPASGKPHSALGMIKEFSVK